MTRKPAPAAKPYPFNEFNPGRKSLQHLELEPTTNLLEGFGAAWLRLYGITYDNEVQSGQWEMGSTPVPSEDTAERASGQVNDPTPTIAYDSRRLALRDAVTTAERTLADTLATLQQARADLTLALGHNLEPRNSRP